MRRAASRSASAAAKSPAPTAPEPPAPPPAASVPEDTLWEDELASVEHDLEMRQRARLAPRQRVDKAAWAVRQATSEQVASSSEDESSVEVPVPKHPLPRARRRMHAPEDRDVPSPKINVCARTISTALARSSHGGQAMAAAIVSAGEIEFSKHMIEYEHDIEHEHTLLVCTRRYHAAMQELQESGLGMCCDGFATGDCTHGMRCECGWLRAPWPWTHYRPGGVHCDCHRDSRVECMSIITGTGDCDFTESSLLWPDSGPHRGIISAGVASMSCYSDDIG